MASDRQKGPGIVRMVTDLVRAPFYERAVRAREAEAELLMIEATMGAMEQVTRIAQRPEDEGLIPVLGANPRNPTGTHTATLRQQAQKAAFTDPLLRGYLRTLVRFVMGRGVTIVAETGDEALDQKINTWLETFRTINNWEALEDEIPERTLRDGESFIRQFVQQEDGPLPLKLTTRQRQRLDEINVTVDETKGARIPKGMTLLRMVDPDQIRDPKDVFPEGIVAVSGDAQNVIGYIWTRGIDDQNGKFIPAEEMEHTKIGVDSDVLRGRSIFEPLLKKASQYEDWLQSRIFLSIARSSIYLFRKITGTRTQGQAIRDQEEKERDSTNDQRVRMPKRGSTVTHGPGIEHEFKAPNLQAQDAQHDGRAIQLNMAVGMGLPEYMATGDSSNANYASSLVSEGPAFREFEFWQDFFSTPFIRVHRWALINGVAAGAIEGLTKAKALKIKLFVKWPNIEVRDEKEHAEANEIRKRNGILSGQGWAEDDGIDWPLEKARIEQERQEDFDFTSPTPANPDGD